MSNFVDYAGSRQSLIKAMEPGTGFELSNMVPEMTEYRGFLTPSLITNILNPTFTPMMDNTFFYDESVTTAVMPNGKRYDDKGNIIGKDRPKQHRFGIPSSGLQYVVKNRDVKNKRIPGTQDMMTHEYLIAREQMKVMKAYDLYNEYNLAKVLMTDVMDPLDGGAYFTPPNYYTEIVGTPRGADTLMNLAGTDLSTYRSTIEDTKDAIVEEAARHGRTISGFVMLCGKDYFNGVRTLEENENLAREIRGIDLIQEETPILSAGGFENLRFLDGSDGVRYIKYSANVLTGTKLIADDKAVLIPLGVQDFFYVGLAPTDNDPDLCTQEGRNMYMWSEKNRQGYHFEVESNRLYGCKLPQLIARFDADAA